MCEINNVTLVGKGRDQRSRHRVFTRFEHTEAAVFFGFLAPWTSKLFLPDVFESYGVLRAVTM